jgi:hypothetical protein
MSDDPKLSQRYRELPREEPPGALDDRILAASRRAVHRRRRWYAPVAAAAVIVLAVAVVMQIDREQPEREVVTPSAQVLETPPPPPARAPAEPPQVAQKPARDQFTPDPRADSGRRAEIARAPAAPAATASALAGVAPSPEQWLQGIADLRRQGRHEEADRELAEFRKRYPDYRLSDEMKAKVERRQ